MRLAIRPAILTDLPSIVRIYNEAIDTGVSISDRQAVSVDSRRNWFEKHTPTRRPLWVLEQEETVIGWIGLQSYDQSPAFDETVEVSLYIAAAHRRRGLGTKLLDHAIKECPNLGVSVLIGFLFRQNQAITKLNRKVGFRRWGLLPKVARANGMYRDLVIMGLDLRA